MNSMLTSYRDGLKAQKYILIIVPVIATLLTMFLELKLGLGIAIALLLVTPLICFYNFYLAIRYKVVFVRLSEKPYYKEQSPVIYFLMLSLFFSIGTGLFSFIIFMRLNYIA